MALAYLVEEDARADGVELQHEKLISTFFTHGQEKIRR